MPHGAVAGLRLLLLLLCSRLLLSVVSFSLLGGDRAKALAAAAAAHATRFLHVLHRGFVDGWVLPVRGDGSVGRGEDESGITKQAKRTVFFSQSTPDNQQ